MNTFATKLLEILAKATWERIRFGYELNCSQGEETITDINLLDLKRAGSPGMYILKTGKVEEAEYGIDWEWWIGSEINPLIGGWWRYAIQAKKLDSSGRYNALRHKVGDRYQFDILTEYARRNKCIPLYCLYNYVREDVEQYWHCCSFKCEPTQLGCTIAPLDAIAPAFYKGASKKFSYIHQNESVIPWRCLVCCRDLMPSDLNIINPLAIGDYADSRLYKSAPFTRSQITQTGDFLFPNDYYNAELGVYPKRVLVVDVGLAGQFG